MDGSFTDNLGAGVRGLRIAFSSDLGFAKVDSEVAAIVEEAALSFESSGATLVKAAPEVADPLEMYTRLWMPARTKAVYDMGPDRATHLDVGHRRQAELGRHISIMNYLDAQEQRHDFCRKMADFFRRYDLLLTPTLPDTAWEAGLDYPPGNPPDPPESIRRISLCYTFSLAQLPVCSVPAGFSMQGLPVGMQIAGPRFADARVLQAAAALEKARPWSHRHPPVCDKQFGLQSQSTVSS
jgi:aspartyl-tRNA(Asn)/glutamyl-tRNA(Gln) amidotransferase subunit A